MTYRECYEEGRKTLEAARISEAKLDAGMLLEYVCHTGRNDLFAHGDREVPRELSQQYGRLIARRAEHIPLQHLTGVQEFMGLTFAVNEHVLIPRQDTEILVEEVMQELQDGMRILDMCTGSGCIIVSLMHYSNDCQGVGADISAEALKLAGQNAERLLAGRCQCSLFVHENASAWDSGACGTVPCDSGEAGMGTTGAALRLVQGDLFEHIRGKYDVIVSNPPYIPSDVIPTLMPEVREHEPLQALDGREDGLYFYRRIVAESRDYLARGGRLYFEIGCDQGEAVRALMEQAGFKEIQVIKDYAGLDRVVHGAFYLT